MAKREKEMKLLPRSERCQFIVSLFLQMCIRRKKRGGGWENSKNKNLRGENYPFNSSVAADVVG
jgi:hypothetical protein